MHRKGAVDTNTGKKNQALGMAEDSSKTRNNGQVYGARRAGRYPLDGGIRGRIGKMSRCVDGEAENRRCAIF
jgi:hypothetical protein